MEAPPAAQAVLDPAPVQVQVVRERPGRMALRAGLLPLLALLAGGVMMLGKALDSPVLHDSGVGLGLLGGALLWVWLRRRYPEAGLEVTGTLTLETGTVVWQAPGKPPYRAALLPAGPTVTIWYTGYEAEWVGRVEFPGYENFLQIGRGPRHRIWVPDGDVTAGLQQLLRSWYHRRVPVKEYCQGGRTFLLARKLSYEQIRAYEREFGVPLYK